MNVACARRPEVWWSDDPEDRAYAAGHCAVCPLAAMCADLGRDEPWGVWAGEVHDNVLELIEPPVAEHQPSRAAYVAGCGCDGCRSENARYVAARRAESACHTTRDREPDRFEQLALGVA